MAASINGSPVQRGQDMLGQTIVVIGGSSGIGLETARLARAKGAGIILTARHPDRLHRAGLELGASIAAFDATDFDRLERFFDALPTPIDHLLVTGSGPCHAPPPDFDPDAARRDIDAHLLLPLQVAWHAASKVRPPGTLLFIGGTGGRRTAAGRSLIAAARRPFGGRHPEVLALTARGGAAGAEDGLQILEGRSVGRHDLDSTGHCRSGLAGHRAGHRLPDHGIGHILQSPGE